MRRRAFLTLLGGTAAGWPLAAHAQQEGRIARVGVIGPSLDRPGMRAAFPYFLADLRKLGFVEGRNLQIEFRSDDRGASQTVAAVNELIAWEADVLFLWGAESALRAAIAARPSLPVVLAAINFDPIARGYVQGLARPGGNVTGLISRWLEITAKQVELLQEAFPDRKRLGVLWDARSADQFEAALQEAKARRLTLHPFKLENPPYDFPAAFRALSQGGAQMLLISSSPFFSRQSAKIASLAVEHRLPAMFILKHYVEVGGLMSYGVDFAQLMRRSASYVAKILRGANPADLPVEQSAHFEFVVNLKTAKAMGIALPTATLLRADEVIE
jgi:putative ABC transport system substrate-binding protein